MNLWPSTFRASLAGGLAAGGVAAVFSFVVVEPTVRLALEVEESRAAADHAQGEHTHEAELVSRSLQQVGGAIAVIVAALLLSVLYAVALSRFRRSSKLSDLTSALVVAGGGFTIFALAPGLKYPANPPAVGDPDTVTERTLLYGCAIAIAALTVTALLAVVRAARRRGWSTTRLSWSIVGVVAAGCVVLFAGLPAGPDAIPTDVGAGLVWQFRLRSLGTLAVLWTTLGLVTGTLLARAHHSATAYDRTHRVLNGR
ncbi:CbtA family protein [Kribbella sp. NPDC050241]|uniref:CbtA family protein n=1 Tax=Kribbella sp. NPDC050241 TaxID=3364115 RepID=UPI0037ABD949